MGSKPCVYQPHLHLCINVRSRPTTNSPGASATSECYCLHVCSSLRQANSCTRSQGANVNERHADTCRNTVGNIQLVASPGIVTFPLPSGLIPLTVSRVAFNVPSTATERPVLTFTPPNVVVVATGNV